jgi:multidrug efflux system membrane fusion protein
VVGDDNIVTAHPITVTQQSEDNAVIANGLTPNDRVVTTGFANLADGAKVLIGRDDQTITPDLAPRRRQGGEQGQKQGERNGRQRGVQGAAGGANTGSEQGSNPDQGGQSGGAKARP